jgi:hypothetical protein
MMETENGDLRKGFLRRGTGESAVPDIQQVECAKLGPFIVQPYP